MVEELKSMVGYEETIYYEGKPDRKCFILESIFNPLLPIAIIWALFDLGFLGAAGFGMTGGMQMILIPFMLFHMMPVWIYLFGVIFSFKRYKNTNEISMMGTEAKLKIYSLPWKTANSPSF